MSTTSPTPDGPSNPTPRGSSNVPAACNSDMLSQLTPPTAPASEYEQPRANHLILGQRLIIEYSTLWQGNSEALDSARMYIITPFGSSSSKSTPYILKLRTEDKVTETRFLQALHAIRGSTRTPDDRDLIGWLRAFAEETPALEIFNELAESDRRGRLIPSMTYFSPPFAQLDQELFSPRARYLSNRIHNGVYQECICSIDALNNVITASFSEASASLQVGNIGSLSASKALDSDLSGQQRHKESWTHLKRVAQEVMDTFVAYGPRCAIAALQNKLPAGCRVPDERVPRDLDDRLSLGIVRDLSAAKVVQLPSGGRATLEVGDDVAALSISTSKTEGGSTFALVFDSRKHKEPAALIDEKLTKIRALMDDLATGSFNSQVLALDHLQQLATDQFDRRCTLAHVCGSNTAQVLSTLHELGSLRVWLPNTASQRGRLELLQGYERVHITLAQPSGSELPLVAFSSIELLISPHGAIDIFAWNNLRNCLSAQLSAESVEHLGGTGNVALRLALAISTHDRSQAHTRLYRLLAQMVATAPSESQLMSAPFASRHTFPPDNEWERRSFNLATNIVETAHGFSKSYGNHAASWLSLSRSTAIIDFLGGAHILRFYTNDTSITGVHIENRPVSFTKYELTIHRFHIEGPASELLQQRLPELLQDYAEFATQHDGPTPDSAILARTRLFAFLVEHGKPMTTQSASDISTP